MLEGLHWRQEPEGDVARVVLHHFAGQSHNSNTISGIGWPARGTVPQGGETDGLPASDTGVNALKRWFPLIAAVLFAGLITVSIVISPNTPGGNAPAGQTLAYYLASHKHHIGGGAALTTWGVLTGVAFFGCVFQRIRAASPVLAAVGLVGAALFAVGGLLAAGSFFALSDTPKVLTASTASAHLVLLRAYQP
jgi:hypothetical protein